MHICMTYLDPARSGADTQPGYPLIKAPPPSRGRKLHRLRAQKEQIGFDPLRLRRHGGNLQRVKAHVRELPAHAYGTTPTEEMFATLVAFIPA